MDLTKLRYAPSHEWVTTDGDELTVGVTKFAVDQLTDVTYLELPKLGTALKAGAEFGVIESVKSTSSLYAPVGGEVVAVNAAAAADPAVVNSDPFGAGWLVKLRVPAGTSFDHLLTHDKYEAQLAGH